MSKGCLTAAQLTVPGRLQGVDLEVRPGELLGLLGPNGAGKSTLLSELSGTGTRHVAPIRSAAAQGVHGTVSWHDHPLSVVPARERARAIGYLPQQVVSAWDLCVRDVVALGRLPWGDDDVAGAVDQAMHQTDVWALRARSVRTLSGGEWARVCLARVLAGEPEVLLVDEPTSHLDLSHQLEVMAVLQAQVQSGRAVVVAVHDLGLAARYCHRLVLLHHGRVAAQGTVDEVLRPDLLREVYGVAVHVDLQAVPPVVLPC